MILENFEYYRPTSLRDAALLYLEGASAYLAGGTDLLVEMGKEKKLPKRVIDLKRIEPGLRQISLSSEGKDLRIGSLATFADLERSPLIRQWAPCLAEAAALVGATPIRARGTIGGNLCSALPSADTAPPLLTFDTQLRLYGPEGERQLKLQDFFLAPHKSALGPGEILTEIRLPLAEGHWRSCYFKHTRRQSLDLSQLGLSLRVKLLDGRIGACRIALGTAGPVPLRAPAGEAYLTGKALPLTEQDIKELTELLCSEAQVRTSLRASAAYRLELIRAYAKKASVSLGLTEEKGATLK